MNQLPDLDYEEVRTWSDFQDLVSDYFAECRKVSRYNINSVRTKVSGRGNDGARDILLTLGMDDGISPFERIWVVQCKYHSKAISPRELSGKSIHDLLQSYKAHGYLLVCSNEVTSGTTNLLEQLESVSKSGHLFRHWNGNGFKRRLRDFPQLFEHYFPRHHAFLEAVRRNQANLQP